MNTRIFKILMIFCFMVAPLLSLAQNRDFNNKTFPGQQKELKKAKKNIRKGDALFLMETKGTYAEALDHYLKANNFNPNNASLNYKIGVCFLKSYYKNLALSYLENALALDPAISHDIWLFLGEAYQFQSYFNKALDCYTKYKVGLNAREMTRFGVHIDKLIMECNSALALASNSTIVRFDRLTEKVNSAGDEYCPLVDDQANFMAFTSRRSSNTGGKINPLDYLYYEDVLFAKRDKDMAWESPYNPGKPLNGWSNDATIELSPDGNIITVYKNIGTKNFICESRKQSDNKWSKPKKFSREINKGRFHEPSAAFTSDRNTVYFISDRNDGVGGADLYVSHKNPGGTWDPPVNMGAGLNSPYDEEAPFLLNDSTLYYSSKGFNSIGGYDIFLAKMKSDGTWSQPVNLGIPLNSPADDLYLIVSGDGDSYLSSNRMDGYGGFDIYHARFNFNVDVLLADIAPVFIHGAIIDEQTANGVIAQVNVHDKTGENLVPSGTSDNLGKFVVSVPSMKSYNMIIQPELCDSLDIKVVKQFGTVYHPDYEPLGQDSLARTIINGKIMDPVTALPYQFPVEIIDMKNMMVVVRILPDTNGNFQVELPSASSYIMNVMTAGCKKTEIATTPPVNYTSSVVVGMMVNLQNIYFDFDRSYIRPDAVEILNRHSKLFAEHPKWKIQINGHTDNMGSEVYNIYLSKKRTESVASYLVSKGVKRHQLKLEWYGYSSPATPNTTQEGRQLNRRCELMVIKD